MLQALEMEFSRRKLLLAAAAATPAVRSAPPAAAAEVSQTLARELQRTHPDFIAFVPRHWDGSANDSHNEHFLVFDGPGGKRMAVWTQSPGIPERGQHNRIMFSRSDDQGVHWEAPRRVAGPAGAGDPTHMASW